MRVIKRLTYRKHSLPKPQELEILVNISEEIRIRHDPDDESNAVLELLIDSDGKEEVKI